MNTKKYLSIGVLLVVFGFLFNLGIENAQAGSLATSTGSISYPGFSMKTDKQSYTKGDVISLKIKRLDGKSFPYYIDVIAVEETTRERKFTIRRKVDVTAPAGTIVQINTSSVEPFARGENGRYLLVVRAFGEKISNGSNSNSIFINYTIPPSITVLSPNGGESWIQGNTYTIRWQSSGLDKVNINLISYSSLAYGMQYGVASAIPASTGYYSWTIPTSVPLGSYYKITIGSEATNDFSDNYFKIIPLVPIPASITVLSPNGGEKCVKGQVCKIKWVAKGIKKLMIGLQGPSSRTILANISASTGYYNWVVPTDIVASSTYKILIGDIDSPVNDQSDNYFSILAASTTQALSR